MPNVTYINLAILQQDGKINNKNVCSFHLIPRTVYCYNVGEFSGLNTSFVLASISIPGVYFVEPMRPEPVLCNKRSHRDEKPVHRNEERPLLSTTREKPMQQQRPGAAKKKQETETASCMH